MTSEMIKQIRAIAELMNSLGITHIRHNFDVQPKTRHGENLGQVDVQFHDENGTVCQSAVWRKDLGSY